VKLSDPRKKKTHPKLQKKRKVSLKRIERKKETMKRELKQNANN
jgi:hypothetical protein